MKDTKTNRGFSFSGFMDFYGNECSIQKSSVAAEDCIWLGVKESKPKIMALQAITHGIKTDETTGWIHYPIHEDVNLTTRMHLSREQVADLIPYLQKFVDTGDI